MWQREIRNDFRRLANTDLQQEIRNGGPVRTRVLTDLMDPLSSGKGVRVTALCERDAHRKDNLIRHDFGVLQLQVGGSCRYEDGTEREIVSLLVFGELGLSILTA